MKGGEVMTNDEFNQRFEKVVAGVNSKLNSKESIDEMNKELDLENTDPNFVTLKMANFYSQNLLRELFREFLVNDN